MAEDSDLEKTEQASPKRIEKAREAGDVPRSKELATVTTLLAAGLGFLMLQNNLGDALKTSLSSGLSFDRSAAFDSGFLLANISSSLMALLTAFAPFAHPDPVVSSQFAPPTWPYNGYAPYSLNIAIKCTLAERTGPTNGASWQ